MTKDEQTEAGKRLAQLDEELRAMWVVALANALWRRQVIGEARAHGKTVLPQECNYVDSACDMAKAGLRLAEAQIAEPGVQLVALHRIAPFETDAASIERAKRYIIERDREQPHRTVTIEDLERWVQLDRQRLQNRLAARDTCGSTALLDAEIDMIRATIGQFEAELKFVRLQSAHAAQHREAVDGRH